MIVDLAANNGNRVKYGCRNMIVDGSFVILYEAYVVDHTVGWKRKTEDMVIIPSHTFMALSVEKEPSDADAPYVADNPA